MFTEQATEIDEADREIVVVRDKTLALHECAGRLSAGSAALNAELELILQRQDEMHAALSELERKVCACVRVRVAVGGRMAGRSRC